jgi:hypothetical protein
MGVDQPRENARIRITLGKGEGRTDGPRPDAGYRLQAGGADVGPTPAGEVDSEHRRHIPYHRGPHADILALFRWPYRHCFADGASVS